MRRAYGVDGGDPALYHLALDSTALGLDACVELIVTAACDRATVTQTHDRASCNDQAPAKTLTPGAIWATGPVTSPTI